MKVSGCLVTYDVTYNGSNWQEMVLILPERPSDCKLQITVSIE